MRLSILTYSLFVLGILVGSSPMSAAQDDIQVKVSIDRDTIGLDEHATLQVEIIGETQNLPGPQMPTLSKFEVYSQGRSSNISIVNGQVSASVTYRYLLLPQEAGTFPISRVAVVHQNKRFEGNTVELTVLSTGTGGSPKLDERATDSGGKSKDYFMEAVVDNRNPFVNQQVTLTLRIHFAVQYYGSPELQEPTTTGFWTEVLGNKAPYHQKIKGRTYKTIERKYALFPTQTGTLTIGRAAITATVAARARRSRDPFDVFGLFGRGQEISMRSRPIEVNVIPLPTRGRPKDFTGTIGKFDISATANKSEVEVNQPVSVTFRIKGVGNIKSVAEPHLPELDDFRVYRASSSENVTKLDDRIGGTKVFEEVFIPKRPGSLTIPSVSFTYFDPQKRRYEIVRTRTITLQVRKPEGYVAGPDVPYTMPGMTIGSRATDIRYIKEEMGKLKPLGHLVIFNPVYLAVNALPVIVMFGMVIARRRRERLAVDVGYARSRAAWREARRRLRKAKSIASADKASEFYAEISLALIAYVADKLNISPHGLTSQQLSELLTGRSDDEQLVPDTLEFLQACDFARFAPATVTDQNIGQALTTAEEIMVRIGGARFV